MMYFKVLITAIGNINMSTLFGLLECLFCVASNEDINKTSPQLLATSLYIFCFFIFIFIYFLFFSFFLFYFIVFGRFILRPSDDNTIAMINDAETVNDIISLFIQHYDYLEEVFILLFIYILIIFIFLFLLLGS